MLKDIKEEKTIFDLTKKDLIRLGLQEINIHTEKIRKRRKSSEFTSFSSFNLILNDIKNRNNLSTIKFLKFLQKMVVEIQNNNFTVTDDNFEFCAHFKNVLNNKISECLTDEQKKQYVNLSFFLEILFNISFEGLLNKNDLKVFCKNQSSSELGLKIEFLMFLMTTFLELFESKKLFFSLIEIQQELLFELENRSVNSPHSDTGIIQFLSLTKNFKDFQMQLRTNHQQKVENAYKEKMKAFSRKLINIENINFN